MGGWGGSWGVFVNFVSFQFPAVLVLVDVKVLET